MKKKAMIFAAGLGTRLRPLTNNKPKALVEVDGIPLLEIAIRRLKYFEFQDIIINVHHFADQIIHFLEERQYFDLNIVISDERDLLLDTGGGLKKAAWFFDKEPFLVCNADILSSIDLDKFYTQNIQSQAIATLAMRNRESSRHLLFNEEGLLAGWRHNLKKEEILCRPQDNPLQPLAFSGLHIIRPAIFDFFPEEAVFSIINLYLEVGRHTPIQYYLHDQSLWLDVGKPAALEKAGAVLDKIKHTLA